MKTCSACKKVKNLEDFNRHPQTRDGLQSNCQDCARASARLCSKRKYANPCPIFQSNLAQVKREEQYRRKYGITIKDYDAQFSHQNGRCAICGTTEPGRKITNFHVDHDHTTGAVRGLLCIACNIGMGWLHDDPLLLTEACAYLINPPSIL